MAIPRASQLGSWVNTKRFADGQPKDSKSRDSASDPSNLTRTARTSHLIRAPNSKDPSPRPWLGVEQVDVGGKPLPDIHYRWQAEESDWQRREETLPNASRKASADHDTNGNSASDFPTSLARLISEHLSAAPANTSESTSRVMASLLDTIHTLQSQVDSLGLKLKTDRTQLEDDLPQGRSPHFRVLHRVFCDKIDHCHNKVVYKDQPRFERDIGWGTDEVLRGSEPIYNVQTYLGQTPALHFVVFKEYMCSHDHEGKDNSEQKRTYETDTISHRKERMRILSPYLQKTLLNAAHPDSRGSMKPTINVCEMDAPYDFLFHHHQTLISMAKEDNTSQAILEPLLTFLADNYVAEFNEAKEQFNQGLTSTMNLGKLFHPNQIIIARNSRTGAIRGGIISRCQSLESGGIFVGGWSWKYDGFDLTRTQWTGFMPALPVEPIPILDLAIYPFEFATGGEKQRLEQRGNKFWSMREQTYASYSGWDVARSRSYTDTRFMVDLRTYTKVNPDAVLGDFDTEGPLFAAAASDDNKFKADDDWPVSIRNSDPNIPWEMLAILPPTTMGFDMVEKRWVHLQADNFTSIKWNKQAFDMLVLEKDHKKLLRTVISSREADRPFEADFIQGKGSGLTILLHGIPGVGKTFTAESIAEAMEKPLYHLTTGDIGTEPEEAETHLRSAFLLAQTWGSIVLFDEADVFLEARSRDQLKRNALTSVFLRVLEYYEGIIFLTTNRVHILDDAVMSRIHIAIHYDTLNATSRLQLWENFLRLYGQDEGIDVTDLRSHLHEVASHDFSGRQIQTAMKQARDLARYSHEPMGLTHILDTMVKIAALPRYLHGRPVQTNGHVETAAIHQYIPTPLERKEQTLETYNGSRSESQDKARDVSTETKGLVRTWSG